MKNCKGQMTQFIQEINYTTTKKKKKGKENL